MLKNKTRSTSSSEQNSTARIIMIAASVAVILIAGYATWSYFSSPPRLAASSDAANTVDALFTAINAHDEDKLALCMERIEGFAKNGELGEKMIVELRYCERLAKERSWDKAAKRLYWLIYDQSP